MHRSFCRNCTNSRFWFKVYFFLIWTTVFLGGPFSWYVAVHGLARGLGSCDFQCYYSCAYSACTEVLIIPLHMNLTWGQASLHPDIFGLYWLSQRLHMDVRLGSQGDHCFGTMTDNFFFFCHYLWPPCVTSFGSYMLQSLGSWLIHCFVLQENKRSRCML